MAMTWSEQVQFILKEDLTVSRIKFLDDVKNVIDDIHAESPADRFDADFVLSTGVLQQFIRDLFKAVGVKTKAKSEEVKTEKVEEAEMA